MNSAYDWYDQLTKPSWAPPEWLFGPVWTLLYIIIFFTFGWVFIQFYKRKIEFIVALPFMLNLFFNFIFTPIQFGLKSNGLAAIDISLVLITLIWGMLSIWKYSKWITILNIPYLLWVCFATVLQFTITLLN